MYAGEGELRERSLVVLAIDLRRNVVDLGTILDGAWSEVPREKTAQEAHSLEAGLDTVEEELQKSMEVVLGLRQRVTALVKRV